MNGTVDELYTYVYVNDVDSYMNWELHYMKLYCMMHGHVWSEMLCV